MQALANVLNKIFEFIFLPFVDVDPLYGLVAFSVITAFLVLIVFKYTSSPEQIRKSKNAIKAHLLEFWLYRDDMSLMFAAQRKILWQSLVYLKQQLRSLLVMIVPLVLIFIQLDMRYGHNPLRPGESAIIALTLSDDNSVNTSDATIRVPDIIKLETPALRIPELREVDWRVKPLEAGVFDLEFQVAGHKLHKQLVVEDGLIPFSPVTSQAGFLGEILYPAEAHLPKGSVAKSIVIEYPSEVLSLFGWKIPSRSLNFLGWRVHWLIAFFLVSTLCVLAMKKLFRVEL